MTLESPPAPAPAPVRAPAPVVANETIGSVISAIVNFFTDRNIHKLAGTAVATLGLVSTNHFETIVGGVYAAVMHYVGGMKKVPD